jgi:hypothetical protein
MNHIKQLKSSTYDNESNLAVICQRQIIIEEGINITHTDSLGDILASIYKLSGNNLQRLDDG